VKIAGSAVLHAPAEQVWAALNDPAVLVRTIPGCQQLEAVGQDAYAMTVAAGVASIKGVYQGKVALHDQQPPGSFRLTASGAGAPGTVSADVLVSLVDAGDGTTRLDYDADAVVGGMVGGVGQRMLTGVAKKTAGEFFSAVDKVLAGTEAPTAASSVVRARLRSRRRVPPVCRAPRRPDRARCSPRRAPAPRGSCSGGRRRRRSPARRARRQRRDPPALTGPSTRRGEPVRAFTAAALQLAPLPGPLTAEVVTGNLAKAVEWVERCVAATGAELVVLPESASTGFTPACRRSSCGT
jgi:carbon monoxide dehydrogenase subunit G